ncbi:MAG: LysR family transcriptional regulator [Paracoccaceae bacterium]
MPRAKTSIDIRDLVGVAETAAQRSFTVAADQLNTTQSTLSRQVARIENELSVTVFRRGWSGTETTREGDLVCQHARAIRTLLAAAEGRLYSATDKHPRFETSLTLAQLEIVDAVRRTRGATAAGNELGRNQSSVSRSLSDLQQHLGLTLFSRSTRGLEPLPAALEFCDLFERISRVIETLRAQLKREQGELAGRVAIGILPFSAQGIVARAFAQISERHPRPGWCWSRAPIPASSGPCVRAKSKA